MKLISYARDGAVRPGLWLGEGRALDLQAAAGFASALEIIAGGREALERCRALEAAPPALAIVTLAKGDLLAPIPRPARNVFCVGLNYTDHAAEGGFDIPKYPAFFSKPPSTVVGPDFDVRLDPKITRLLDYEVELAVVIGQGGRDIARADALNHVWGYTVANDVTARDLQRRHQQWFKGKALDTTLPLGPWIVDKESLGALGARAVTMSVNGESRQDGRTDKMIFDVPAIIASLSEGMSLEPGDIIITGTPAGVGYAMTPPRPLADGDVMVAAIEGVGVLTNRVAAV